MAAKNATVRSLGRAVRTIRVERGLSQETVALHGGLARSFFGRVERGEVSPTYETIVKVATGLGVDAAEIVALAERYRTGAQEASSG